MANAPVYQIAFKFQFNQDFTNQKVQIDVTDTNNFVMSDTRQTQLQAYLSESTPPLLNFSASGQQLFFNVGSGKQYGGMQSVAWSTFTAGSDPTLDLNLQFSSGLINASYTVLNTGASGQLLPGNNTIKAQ